MMVRWNIFEKLSRLGLDFRVKRNIYFSTWKFIFTLLFQFFRRVDLNFDSETGPAFFMDGDCLIWHLSLQQRWLPSIIRTWSKTNDFLAGHFWYFWPCDSIQGLFFLWFFKLAGFSRLSLFCFHFVSFRFRPHFNIKNMSSYNEFNVQ